MKIGYGNYCGPWWSDGKIQSSVDGASLPVDELDRLCREHDRVYYYGGDLAEADIHFARQAASQSAFGVGMAVARVAGIGSGGEKQIVQSFSHEYGEIIV